MPGTNINSMDPELNGQVAEANVPVGAPVQSGTTATVESSAPSTPYTVSQYTPGTNVVDLAEIGSLNFWDLNNLRRRGFTYQDPDTGELRTYAPNTISYGDMAKLTRTARRRERTDRRWGLNTTGSWSPEAVALRQAQVQGDDNFSRLIAKPAAAPKTYKFDFTGMDEKYYDHSKKVLQALYDNQQFDTLDRLAGEGGVINWANLQNYYNGLGFSTAPTFFNKDVLGKMGTDNLLSADAVNTLTNGLPTTEPAAPDPEAPKTYTFKNKFGQDVSGTAEEIAALVWKGQFDDGAERKRLLGNDYDTIQSIVRQGRPANKQGGRIMKYFQPGGSLAASKVNDEKVAAAQKVLSGIFDYFAKGDYEGGFIAARENGIAPEQIFKIAQDAAEKNPEAQRVVSNLMAWAQQNPERLQAIQQGAVAAKAGAVYAKQGTKLQYIKRLRGECPEGYEMQTFRVGGKFCQKCAKIEADKCGGKAKKHENGGEAPLVSEFKNKRKKN